MSANPIRVPVEGAPYQPGAAVKVVGACDETARPKYIGRLGTVVYLEYECGSGQEYPRDPMIGVKFAGDASKKEASWEFWREELAAVPS